MCSPSPHPHPFSGPHGLCLPPLSWPQVHSFLAEIFGHGSAAHGGHPPTPPPAGAPPGRSPPYGAGIGGGTAYFRFNPLVPKWAQARMDETSPEILDQWIRIGREHVTTGHGADDMAALARALAAAAPPPHAPARRAPQRGGGWLAPAWWGSAARELMRQWLAARRPLRAGPFGRSRL